MTQTHIFYRPEMSVDGLDSYSPSAGKPTAFVETMQSSKIHGDTNVLSFEPIAKRDLYLAHSTEYVDCVFQLIEPNGFDNFDPRVPPSTLYTVGSLVAAVLARGSLKGSVCSPTSGFHHAGHNFGGGFCTFNGLMVAAAKYLQVHPGHKVGILDCDVHYGNGTDDILKALPQYRDLIVHRTAGATFTPGDDTIGTRLFKWLYRAMDDMTDCDVVIYQAGGDMAAGDPLGGYLDQVCMYRRDQMVFEELGDKVVWNLAGGYQGLEKTVYIHKTTAMIAVRAAEQNGSPLGGAT